MFHRRCTATSSYQTEQRHYIAIEVTWRSVSTFQRNSLPHTKQGSATTMGISDFLQLAPSLCSLFSLFFTSCLSRRVYKSNALPWSDITSLVETSVSSLAPVVISANILLYFPSRLFVDLIKNRLQYHHPKTWSSVLPWLCWWSPASLPLATPSRHARVSRAN